MGKTLSCAGAGSGHAVPSPSKTGPKGGQDHPAQGSALQLPLFLALEGSTSIFSHFLVLLGEPGALTSLSGDCVVHGLGDAAVSPHTPAPDHGTKAWADTLEFIFRRADPLEKDKFLLDFAPFNPLFPAGFYSIVATSRQHHPSLSHNGWMGSDDVTSPARLLPATPLAQRVREDEKCTKNGNLYQLGNKNLRGFN